MATHPIKRFLLSKTFDLTTVLLITKDTVNKLEKKLYNQMRRRGRWLVGEIEDESNTDFYGGTTIVVHGRFVYVGRKAIKKMTHNYAIKEPIASLTF